MKKDSHYCSITILNVKPEDNGKWTCHVKKNLRSALFSEAFIAVNVASPYSLSVDVPTKLTFDKPSHAKHGKGMHTLQKLNNESVPTTSNDRFASCLASSMDGHGGGIDPQLTWFVNGVEIKNVTPATLHLLVCNVWMFYSLSSSTTDALYIFTPGT